MNREIKFKAKRLDNGEWVKGYLMETPFGTFIEWYDGSICNQREVDPNTVCQFTGRTDENGKELYENDVIWHKSVYYNSLKIAWSDKHLAFRVYNEHGQEEGSLSDCLRLFDCYLQHSALDKEEEL